MYKLCVSVESHCTWGLHSRCALVTRWFTFINYISVNYISNINYICVNNVWLRTLLSTREPTHKEVIFYKMNLKLKELC